MLFVTVLIDLLFCRVCLVLAFVPPVNPTTVHVTTTPSPFVTSATPETSEDLIV